MIWVGVVLTGVSYAAFFAMWIYCSVPHIGGKQTPQISIGLGAVGTFTDFYIISIPLLAISGLNMSRGRKIGVSALFATGLLYAMSLFSSLYKLMPAVVLILICYLFYRACGFSAASLASRFDNYRATVVYNRPDPFWTSMSAYGPAYVPFPNQFHNTELLPNYLC